MPTTIVLGTGRCVPSRRVANADLESLMDTSDEWIRTRTGIEQRYWVDEGDVGAELAGRAAVEALTMAGIEATDLDAIVYATSTPDHFCPGNGVYLQHLLQAGPIPAIDIRTQCSGFVYSLAVADGWIRSGMYRRILVVGQEIQSTRLDVSTEGRNTAVIFADGAGAAVVGATEEAGRGILGFDLHSDGQWADKLWVDGPGAMYHPPVTLEDLEAGKYFLKMDGREVFRHAVAQMPESVNAVLARYRLAPSDIDLLIPHQANLRISEMVQRRLGLRDDQVYNNIQRYGNTTAGTIPIALDECVRADRIQVGQLVVFTAFGSGFMWGSCAMRW